MINIHLPSQDLVGLRFAYSPLIELVISYRMLQHPARHRLGYKGWSENASTSASRFVYLDAVMTPDYIAAFLIPTPSAPEREFHQALKALRETPDDVIRRDITYITQIAPVTPVRQFFLEHPRTAMTHLTNDLYIFWKSVFADHWQQMLPILDNEILYRARSFALHGAPESLNQLANNVYFDAGILQIDGPGYQTRTIDYHPDGNGIQLVPSMFKTQGSSYIRTGYRAMVIYPAYASGTLQDRDNPSDSESLRLLLGESRLEIMLSLSQPQSTHELATKLYLSAGSISQHLQRLHRMGLVESYRSSYYVFYRLSERGENLLELFNS